MLEPRRSCRRSLAILALSVLVLVDAYTPGARWGQATTLVGNTLYVHGGKTDPSNMYSYNGAPNTNDLISLDLSSAFVLSNPPWTYVSGSSASSSSEGPLVAFHSLTAFNSTTVLMFGGDGGSTMSLPSRPDSAWLLDVSSPDLPNWFQQPESWANEPVRSIRHSAASSFGRIWITGGERADGSNLPAAGHYVFQPSVPSFDQLPTDGAPPVLAGHASVMLPSGVLLVFGGYNPTSNAMADMSTVWMVDTSQTIPVWSNITTTGAIPVARRDFAYTTLGDGRVFIHGGADAAMENVYSDASILDVAQNPMQWSSIDGLEQIGARRNHMAVGVGDQVLVAFGYGTDGPASAALSLFETNDSTWGTTFVPASIPTPSPPSPPLPSVTNPSTPSQTVVSPPNQSTVSQSASQPTPVPSGTANLPTPGPVPTNHAPHPHTTGASLSSSIVPSPTGSHLPPGDSDSASNIQKIAVGAVLAVIALVGLVICGAYIALRKRRPAWKRGDGSARLISDGPGVDGGYGTDGEKPAPLAGSHWESFQSPRRQWTLLGLGTRQTYGRERFDILHDEDVREFGNFRASQASARREASESSNRSAWGGIINASTSSILSVGAALGLGRGARQSSYASVRPTGQDLENMEKNASNPFIDAPEPGGDPSIPTVALVGSSRPRVARQESSSSLREVAYQNPFDDPNHSLLTPLDEDGHGPLRHPHEGQGLVGAFRQQELEDHGQYDNSIIPESPETYGLAALGRARSNSDLAPSNGSMGSGNAFAPGSGTPTVVGSASSHEYRLGTLMSSAPSAPIRRSDSWWSRFSMSTLRGDRGAHQEGFSIVRKMSRNSDRPSRAETFIEFRDPNPPPPLRMAPIKETGVTPDISPQDVIQGHSRSSTADPAVFGSHRRSVSSLATVKTADSSALERIGQMDIIQRVRTASTYHAQSLSLETSPELVEEQGPTAGTMRRPRLSIVPGSPLQSEPMSTTEGGYSYRESRASTPPLSEDHSTIVTSPTELASSIGHSPIKATTPVRTRQPTGKVAERIAAYERRATETTPVTPSPRKSPVGSAVGEANYSRPRSHVRVEYGLAERPELFIANPDGRSSPAF